MTNVEYRSNFRLTKTTHTLSWKANSWLHNVSILQKIDHFIMGPFCNDLNSLRPSNAMWSHASWSILIQVIDCYSFGTRPLPEPILVYCQFDHWEQTSNKFKHRLQNFSHFKASLCVNHWGRVTHICVSKIGHYWFRQSLVTCSVPRHYQNQWWIIINWTLRNKLHWNFTQNCNIFIQENAFENIVWKMSFWLPLNVLMIRRLIE